MQCPRNISAAVNERFYMRKVFLKKVNFLSPPQFSTVMRRIQFLPTLIQPGYQRPRKACSLIGQFGFCPLKTDQTWQILQPNQSEGIMLKWLQI